VEPESETNYLQVASLGQNSPPVPC